MYAISYYCNATWKQKTIRISSAKIHFHYYIHYKIPGILSCNQCILIGIFLSKGEIYIQYML